MQRNSFNEYSLIVIISETLDDLMILNYPMCFCSFHPVTLHCSKFWLIAVDFAAQSTYLKLNRCGVHIGESSSSVIYFLLVPPCIEPEALYAEVSHGLHKPRLT